jgi:hypothetical protein
LNAAIDKLYDSNGLETVISGKKSSAVVTENGNYNHTLIRFLYLTCDQKQIHVSTSKKVILNIVNGETDQKRIHVSTSKKVILNIVNGETEISRVEFLIVTAIQLRNSLKVLYL